MRHAAPSTNIRTNIRTSDDLLGFDLLDARRSSAIERLRAMGRTEAGRKTLRYAAVSLVAIAVNQLTLVLCYGLLHWDGDRAVRAQLVAFVTSTIPSYYLNRMWVWGKSGKSHMWKEVAPFWAIGLVQLLISVVFVQWAQRAVERSTDSHLLRTGGIMFNSLFIYGLMWVAKFMFFNKVLFAHRPMSPGLEAAVDEVI
jgi:putative flippase GtrA